MLDMADSRRFRSLMSRFVTGVTVIGVAHSQQPGEVVAMTASSVTSVSLSPLLLLFCVRNESRLLPHLQATGGFSVNVLGAHQDDISRYYGGQTGQGARGAWLRDAGSVPALAGANASFLCRSRHLQAFGDHHVVIGEVVDMVSADPPAPALIYACGKYMGVELAHS
ncbi:flavin reductase family protein [Variovorax sp.]|jgi:flavin reductase (DIM6/NTAB) family NADH-FMN oxidoreductase RutF|uniref:flavin reductase family protein n=1 Tax=Variovorax sp. TaxID=1871043 RepID=UPI0012133F87|nr:MAG: flavin reductase [Variovorax sp.]